jgi:8-oxo-dGTP diphosphatase
MAQDTNLGSELALDLGFATELVNSDFQVLAFKNKVVTFTKNHIDLLNIQDGPLTTYADVLYFNQKGEVLLLKRKETDTFEPNKWGFPGGKVMQGETISDGAIREFEEETGLGLSTVELLKEEVNEDESLSVYFHALGLGELPKQLLEHSEAKYYAINDFDGLDFIKNQTERFKSLVNQIVKTEMKNEEKLNAFEKALQGLKNFFKSHLKNMAVVTKEGAAIFIAGAEDGELVGKTVYLAEDGLPTETLAPEGKHTLEDGTVVTLDAAGVIIEVEAPAPVEDVEALKAAYEKEKIAMQEEKDKLAAQVEAQAKVIEESKKQLNALAKDFADLKNLVPGDPDVKKKKEETPLSAEEFAKLSYSEKIRLRAMAKADIL